MAVVGDRVRRVKTLGLEGTVVAVAPVLSRTGWVYHIKWNNGTYEYLDYDRAFLSRSFEFFRPSPLLPHFSLAYTCLKCGTTSVNDMKYVPASDDMPEHMLRTCCNCSYTWKMAVKQPEETWPGQCA